RLLPGRPDHAGRVAAEPEPQPDRLGHRRGHGWEPVPVRDVLPHPLRHQAGCGGPLQVSHPLQPKTRSGAPPAVWGGAPGAPGVPRRPALLPVSSLPAAAGSRIRPSTSRGRTLMLHHRRATVVASALAILTTLVAAPRPSSAESPLDALAKVGSWIQPFEEGGAAVPRCHAIEKEGWENGQLRCKPAAADIIALPDGRVLYWDGLEGSENVDQSVGWQLGPASQNDQSRVVDLRRGAPVFTTPTPSTGGGVNHEKPNARWTDDPLGTAGVPGRAGDGFVGSTWAALGGPEHRPNNSPNDHDWNDMDLFCSDLAGMADGRVLIAGGIDWYNEPAIMQRSHGDPADVGLVELGGLKTTRIFDPKTDTFSVVGDMHHPRWYPTLVE